MENQTYRTDHSKKQHLNSPSVPPRRNNRQYHFHQNYQKPFYPQIAHLPQIPRPQYFQQQRPWNENLRKNNFFSPPRPFAPKPTAKPQPMDIDQSIQTRQVNYMNRPQQTQFAGKRPPPNSQQTHGAKFQRNYHIDASEENPDYNCNIEDNNFEHYSGNNDHIEEESEEELQDLQLSDIHFLD